MVRANRLGSRRPSRPRPRPGERLINNRQKALVHVAKAQLGLSDEDYREILAGYGVASSRELTERQFNELMKFLGRLGFQRRPPAARRRGQEVYGDERSRYLAAIERLLVEKNLPWNYAHAIGENMFGVRRLEWLEPERLQKVMVALIYHKRRGR